MFKTIKTFTTSKCFVLIETDATSLKLTLKSRYKGCTDKLYFRGDRMFLDNLKALIRDIYDHTLTAGTPDWLRSLNVSLPHNMPYNDGREHVYTLDKTKEAHAITFLVKSKTPRKELKTTDEIYKLFRDFLAKGKFEQESKKGGASKT